MIAAFALPLGQLIVLAIIVFVASLVRGFSGFALSAIIMAAAATLIAPVELIPILWWLELAASLLMLKGGWREADRRVAFGLIIGSVVGLPLGLWLTLSIDPDTSRVVALTILIVLAVMQLAKVRLGFLATDPGLLISGVVAGTVTGLCGAGGMVVALYVLASNLSPAVMRGSLVLYLFGTSFFSMITHILMGTMTWEAVQRGFWLIPVVAVGVVLGQQMFTERFAPYYRPFCLVLLVGLAAASLARTLAGPIL